MSDETIKAQIPDALATRLDSLGRKIQNTMDNSLGWEHGPSFVVNHTMVVLLRLLMPVNPDAVAMLHSVVDLAAQQVRQEQN